MDHAAPSEPDRGLPHQESRDARAHLRAADADRAAVATVLGQHMSAGRLTVDEYDERLARAYAGKTYGELDQLTVDLPAAVPPAPRTPSRPARGHAVSGRQRTRRL